ncbi:MAG: hypothetical protein M5U12_21050 [Verrucomicrobia bacterium]|nr:hypothetical protein [Verrucomicrobiota bacterium]
MRFHESPDMGYYAAPPEMGYYAEPPDYGYYGEPPELGWYAEPPEPYGWYAEPPEMGYYGEPPELSGYAELPEPYGWYAEPPELGYYAEYPELGYYGYGGYAEPPNWHITLNHPSCQAMAVAMARCRRWLVTRNTNRSPRSTRAWLTTVSPSCRDTSASGAPPIIRVVPCPPTLPVWERRLRSRGMSGLARSTPPAINSLPSRIPPPAYRTPSGRSGRRADPPVVFTL